MFKIKTLLIFAIILSGIMSLQAQIELTKDGKSNYTIVVAEDATTAEKYAANELVKYIKKISGTNLPITALPVDGKKAIYVGQSPKVSQLLPTINFNKLKPDEIILKEIDDNIILSGARPRATIYAVYSFLENKCGVRFFTPKCELIPKEKNLLINNLDLRYAPKITQREVYFQDIYENGEFAVKMRCNGPSNYKVGEKLGGHIECLGICHTFEKFLPFKKYGKSHPEYFSLICGKRVGGKKNGQLCLTNLDMTKLFTEIILKKLCKNPNITLVNISPNDNKYICECSKCQARIKAGGSDSALLLEFVNKVARDIEKEFPKVKIETFAYYNTQSAPKNIKAYRNVIVKLCPIQADFRYPVDSPQNGIFAKDLKDWALIAPQLAIWTYTVNFDNYLVPFPTIDAMSADIKNFPKYNINLAFIQGDVKSKLGYFTEFKAYVASKLLWNPQLDSKELQKEFLTNYYGKASKLINEYIQLLTKTSKTSDYKLGCYQKDLSWIPFDTLMKSRKILFKAKKLVENNPVLSERVNKVILQNNITLLLRKELSVFNTNPKYKAIKKTLNLPVLYKQTATQLKEIPVKKYSEGRPLAVLLKKIELNIFKTHQKSNKIPSICKNLKEDQWLEISPDQFGIYCGATKENDSKAAFGKVASIKIRPYKWAVQVMLPTTVDDQYYQVYVSARCSNAKKGNAAEAFMTGIYNMRKKKEMSKKISIGKAKSSKFKFFDLGKHNLKDKSYAFVASRPKSGGSTILVERIILIKKSK